MATRKSNPVGRKRAPAPDLDAILDAFAEAFAVLEVAQAAVSDNPRAGPERVVLRWGVKALNRVYNDLDRAIVSLDAP
jgi:mannose/cellobiose epimerase-like protein (N-acyl-D-glucosamine 2-epimerase family)